MANQYIFNQKQAGNVLFIILIAVALFAALAYAVTQSMRGSGNGGATQEKNTVTAGYVQQFPISIRQAISRLKLSNGVTLDEISFANPENTDYGTFDTVPTKEVFNPAGGAVPYQRPPSDFSDGSQWIFNGDIEINQVGTTLGNSDSTDLVAFLPGIGEDLCKTLNHQITGTWATPVSITVAGEDNKYTGSFTYAGTISDAALNGRETFCYYSTTLAKYVYYEVLLPR